MTVECKENVKELVKKRCEREHNFEARTRMRIRDVLRECIRAEEY
jgi:hypothetical protein